MTTKTKAQLAHQRKLGAIRQDRLRKRLETEENRTEVRGIYAHVDDHAEIKANAKAVAKRRAIVLAPVNPERAAFERWWCNTKLNVGLAQWDLWKELVWDALQAARPKRAAVGAIVNVAASLAQRQPLMAFGVFDNATHIGHRQFGRAYSKADEDTRRMAVRLADAVRALQRKAVD